MTFLFIDMVRVLRLRHWAQRKSTPQQQARVDEGAVDEVVQAEARALAMDAEGRGCRVGQTPNDLGAADFARVEDLRLQRIAFERVIRFSSNSLFLNKQLSLYQR